MKIREMHSQMEHEENWLLKKSTYRSGSFIPLCPNEPNSLGGHIYRQNEHRSSLRKKKKRKGCNGRI